MTGERAFGIFDHIERNAEPLNQIYEGRLRLLEEADAAGFYAYHLAEHHATPLGMAPSPGVFLAALAQRTRKLRFGPLVYLLPLYEPLRLCEEICMLDQLSGGRYQVGVGRGISPFELAYHGVEFLKSREMFEEALEVLVRGLREPRLDFEGRYYRYRDVPIELEPLQRPNPPFWYGATSPERVRWAASRGMNVVGGGPIGLMKALAAAFEEASAVADGPGLRPGGETPRLGALRHVYVAGSDDEVERVARPAYSALYDNIAKLWRDFGTAPTMFTPDLDRARSADAAIAGPPTAVRDEVGRFFEESGCNYLVLSFAWGNLTTDQARRSLDLFASKVMPELA